ncbi:quinone-dependent dihydroorotate dehydrogenase [Sinisalibacter aestuarii]|uniref:Dihydroorotate dehydrogenase (quinone) n=1 Tax=Sinisalibacter aestuarii TaxID=2949426 RepID=A0ABQ5LT60_9RHOB|nr:quinone-dependent dihydroorotate dehydrogenase [Sinisalibacter aestuarii]GKY87446.1 dihydroorotate dehydrogenase (quinone) [Sinisalibacter aestuarii]
MTAYEKLGMAVLHRFGPERAHRLSLMALKAGVAPVPGLYTSPMLQTTIAGMKLPNPVGLAAGYDKNAEVIDALARAGFGFIEAGAITPRPQPGNPAPRLFRLTEDEAIINRMGFNNQGMEAAAQRLRRRSHRHPVPVGLNLGANKDSEDRAGDFVKVFEACGDFVDFVTVNVSSPNTERLRDLQGADALRALLGRVLDEREAMDKYTPVFLKIAPDLGDDEIEAIAEVARSVRLDGIIATNTTIQRKGVKSKSRKEQGGLSGPPLFEKSTRVLAKLSALTQGHLPLIGVGGIDSAETAWAKITAGASAVQLYTALVYHGLGLVDEILRGLEEHLRRDGFTHISQAVGTKRGDWL